MYCSELKCTGMYWSVLSGALTSAGGDRRSAGKVLGDGRRSPPVTDVQESARERAVRHVLHEVHPSRREGSVVGTVPVDDGLLVGVQVKPRGFISTAKYALVTVDDDGRVVRAEPATGREVRRAVDPGA